MNNKESKESLFMVYVFKSVFNDLKHICIKIVHHLKEYSSVYSIVFMLFGLLSLANLVLIYKAETRVDYIDTIDSIIEMKKWVITDKLFTSEIANHEFVKSILENNSNKRKPFNSVEDLMEKCILFYHLEKIYLLNKSDSLILKDENEGFVNEINMWLDLNRIREFYYGFCREHGNYSDEFIDYIDSYYYPDSAE